jgi:hypothetical protein
MMKSHQTILIRPKGGAKDQLSCITPVSAQDCSLSKNNDSKIAVGTFLFFPSISFFNESGHFISPTLLWGLAQCYKTFSGRNLRIFVISLCVCPWQAFPD